MRQASITIAAPAPVQAVSLLPIMAVVFVAFLVIGLAMPVLPLHVQDGLGFGTFMVGLVAGSQFAASLISRPWAGHFSDRRGAKRAVVTGLLAATVAGVLYLLSLWFVGLPLMSVAILLLGRGVLGGAESFIITASVSWGLALASAQNTGKVIAWVGSLAPLGTLLLVAPLPAVAAVRSARASFASVVGAVWLPGLGSALGSVGFGAVTTFVTLLFANHGWQQGWLAYTAYATAFIAARVAFSHLADRIGGAKVALVCVVIEAAGQVFIWLAIRPEMALVGAALTGFGFSLVYPGFGVEAVRRVAPQSRGLAMGAYTAFLDLAQGVASPALGLIASGAGLNAVFLASTLVVLGAAVIAMQLLWGGTVQHG